MTILVCLVVGGCSLKENPTPATAEPLETVESTQVMKKQELSAPVTRLNIVAGRDRLYQNSRTSAELERHRRKSVQARTYPVANTGANGAPVFDSGLVQPTR